MTNTASSELTRVESRAELEVTADGINRERGARPPDTLFLQFGIVIPPPTLKTKQTKTLHVSCLLSSQKLLTYYFGVNIYLQI